MKYILVVLFLIGIALAQEPAKPIQASQAVQNKILKAEHAVDQAALQQAYAQKLFNDAQVAGEAATKAVNEALEQAWTESNLSKADYTFDPANFTFSKKPKAEAKK
jgi:hypothetical protein